MALIEVSSREFRDKQKDFFDLADNGEKVVIRRGRKQSYVLTPVSKDDLYFTPEMVEKIERSVQEVKEGKVTTVKNKEELKEYLNSL